MVLRLWGVGVEQPTKKRNKRNQINLERLEKHAGKKYCKWTRVGVVRVPEAEKESKSSWGASFALINCKNGKALEAGVKGTISNVTWNFTWYSLEQQQTREHGGKKPKRGNGEKSSRKVDETQRFGVY